MQVAVLQHLVSSERSAPLCVKIWPQDFNARPVPLPASFAELPDPADSVVTQLQSRGFGVLPGSACSVGRSGNTVVATGARASAAILHSAEWTRGVGRIVVDMLHGMDGDRLSYRVTASDTGFRADRQE
jgi:hypothetical protein